MFYISQIEKCESGEYLHTERGHNKVISYSGNSNNLPINIDMVLLFDRSCQNIADGQIAYNIIKFENADGVIHIWYYPPGPYGKLMRDSDYFHILNEVGTKCPKYKK